MRLISSLALVIYATGVYASVMDHRLAQRDPKKHDKELDDGGDDGSNGNNNGNNNGNGNTPPTPPECTCDNDTCIVGTINLGGDVIVNYSCKNKVR